MACSKAHVSLVSQMRLGAVPQGVRRRTHNCENCLYAPCIELRKDCALFEVLYHATWSGSQAPFEPRPRVET